MGNACRVASLEDFQSRHRDSVIVLQANGEVMELKQVMRAEALMSQFPNHFLCHASSILLRKKSKMVQPKAQLQPGSIYLLLRFPESEQQEDDHPSDASSAHDPLLQTEVASAGTTKFIISKHYLDKILSEKPGTKTGTVPKKKASLRTSSPAARISSRRRPAQCAQQKMIKRSVDNTTHQVQRKSAISWSPELDSIPEK